MYTKIKNTEMEIERGIQLVNIVLGWPRLTLRQLISRLNSNKICATVVKKGQGMSRTYSKD